MKLMDKQELFSVIRLLARPLEERPQDRDKKTLRYNDVAFTYRVIKMMSGKPVKGPIDKGLVRDLLATSDKAHFLYSPLGPKSWAWTWCLPTKS